MRCFVGFMFVLALAVMGCSETLGAGGSGGSGATGGTGGIGGAGGTGGDGGAGGMPQCESAEDCDDKHACTDDACNPSSGLCENTPIKDGTVCADGRGGCYGGLCNFVPVSIRLGPKETVVDWSADYCDAENKPDGPPQAIRTANGELVLFSGMPWLVRGPDFDSLVTDCNAVHEPARQPTPKSYENYEILWSPYREDANWHVLVHNEFHDSVTPTCVPDPSAGSLCWYNSITYFVSTDDAYSFVKPDAPAHVVAPAPYAWVAPTPDTPPQDDGRFQEGYFSPSSIVRGADDYYYFMMRATPSYLLSAGGSCLVRTQTLNDPASWRAWDGDGFNLALTSPYVTGSQSSVCHFLPPHVDADNLTYNTYLDRYMAVNSDVREVNGQLECGIVFSLSTDLIHWSDYQLVAPCFIQSDMDPQTPGLLEPAPIAYPSIIDHADSTINFERPGRTPHLYYVRFTPGVGPNDDIVRVPLTFTILGGPLCEGVDCDDRNACTEDLCIGADGSCEHAPLPDLSLCPGGFCAAGECELVEPLESCAEVLKREPTAASGIYNLNLGFDTPKPVHCEMQVEGGGWTLVGSMNGWDFCGADPLPEYDLLTDPTKTNGKISDAVVRGIRAGSGHYEVMYYLGLPGPSEYLFKHIDSYWSTLGRDPTHCTWTCADGSADSTTCGDESLGCGFGGRGSPFDTKKLYVGFNGGLHSGGGFCGLDNRLFYPVQVFVR